MLEGTLQTDGYHGVSVTGKHIDLQEGETFKRWTINARIRGWLHWYLHIHIGHRSESLLSIMFSSLTAWIAQHK
jgi:hypothetical protein